MEITGRARRRLGPWALALGMIAAVLTVIGTTAPAQAYPEAVCKLAVHPKTVVGGNPITVTGSSNVSRHWKATFLGHVATGTGKHFSHVFQTPKVSHERTAQVHLSCGGQTLSAAVTLLPPNGGNNGNNGNGNGAAPPSGGGGLLPNTGGPALWILLLGLALVVGGTVAVSRRRGSSPPA